MGSLQFAYKYFKLLAASQFFQGFTAVCGPWEGGVQERRAG
jgi:hypothetical protein